MNAIRQIVDGSALAPIIKIPRSLHGRKVEVIVLPVADSGTGSVAQEKADLPRITKAQLEELRAKSTATKLTGSIPHPYITAQEIREERLAEQYGSFV